LFSLRPNAKSVVIDCDKRLAVNCRNRLRSTRCERKEKHPKNARTNTLKRTSVAHRWLDVYSIHCRILSSIRWSISPAPLTMTTRDIRSATLSVRGLPSLAAAPSTLTRGRFVRLTDAEKWSSRPSTSERSRGSLFETNYSTSGRDGQNVHCTVRS